MSPFRFEDAPPQVSSTPFSDFIRTAGIQYLGEHPPERFVYVSCGLESFLNDAARLTSSGKPPLGTPTAFNLLPFTEHVETVACFERA